MSKKPLVIPKPTAKFDAKFDKRMGVHPGSTDDKKIDRIVAKDAAKATRTGNKR